MIGVYPGRFIRSESGFAGAIRRNLPPLMSANYSVNGIITASRKVIMTWADAAAFKFGQAPDDEHTLASFTVAHDELEATVKTIATKETELKGLRSVRKDQAAAQRARLLRARQAIRVHFGADSAQYEQAGGTRASERKSGLHRGNGGAGDTSAPTI